MIKTMKNIGVAVILSAAVATPVLAQGYAPPPSEQHYNYGQQPPLTNLGAPARAKFWNQVVVDKPRFGGLIFAKN